MDLLDRAQTIAVLGAGRSGIAASNLLVRHGKRVILSDTRTQEALGQALANLDPKVQVHAGANTIEGADLVVVSPGLEPASEIFAQMDAQGVPYVSEIEVAYLLSVAPYVAISGTDGKTTTTTLVGQMFQRALAHVEIAGNIGTPLSEVATQVPKEGMVVAEVSAFQLWTTRAFRAVATGVTNVAADHMDYFEGDTARYAQAKRQTLLHARPSDWAVLNDQDPIVRTWGDDFVGHTIYYATGQDPRPEHPHCLWSQEDGFYGRLHGRALGRWCDGVSRLPLKGNHQHLNMLCAAGMAMSQDVDLAHIVDAMSSFEPLVHRMQPCGESGGVRFWDDSKATNVHAALAGLKGLDGEVVPILGGLDKDLDLTPLLEFCLQRAPRVVVIGAIKQRLTRELIAMGYEASHILAVDSMEEAVRRGFEAASTHGVPHLSLSPACSSFDMYQSYAHRGRLFQDCVRALGEA